MYLSAFELFRIGPGPSSSATVGPQRAALRFVHDLAADGLVGATARVEAELYGGLAFAALEQSTDQAIVAGLCGEAPERCDATAYAATSARVDQDGGLLLGGRHRITHRRERDLHFVVNRAVAYDGNAVRFIARDVGGSPLASRVYYSIGNGAILAEGDVGQAAGKHAPNPFDSAASLLQVCRLRGKRVADVVLANECTWRSPGEVRSGLLRVAHAMLASLHNGLVTHGMLPGGASRTAPRMAEAMAASPISTEERCSRYALAVAEENAAGGRVAAAPSNGSAGPMAALLQTWREEGPPDTEGGTLDFLLAAAGIGQVLRAVGVHHAGCQSEVGVAAAMAAAGYASASGGSNAQVIHAAECAFEPHLGLTCDPAGSRMQDPCIGRNASAAAVAYAAATKALRVPDPPPGLDRVARVAVDRGAAMAGRYKSSSVGAIAVNVAEC